MPRIMIKCPKNNKPVSTGMEKDADEFETFSSEGNSFDCPACGDMHSWEKNDAFLEER